MSQFTRNQQKQRPSSSQRSNPRLNPPPEQQSLPPPPPRDLFFSPWSSPAIRNGSQVGYACEDFMVGVGMVIIQKGTGKVVVVSERKRRKVKVLKENTNRDCDETNVRTDSKEKEDMKQKDDRNGKDKAKDYEYVEYIQDSVFLPKGRKDLGETLQDAALREAYEESGYQVSFLPTYKYTHQPPPPSDELAVMRPNIEPFYMTVTTWNRGEYFVSWFLGEIEEDAIHTPHTGMPDEQNYVSHLVTFDEALEYLSSKMESNVMRYAKRVWENHVSTLLELEHEETRKWLETVGLDQRQGT